MEDKEGRGRKSNFDDEALFEAVEQDESLTTRILSEQFGVDQSTIVRHLQNLGKSDSRRISQLLYRHPSHSKVENRKANTAQPTQSPSNSTGHAANQPKTPTSNLESNGVRKSNRVRTAPKPRDSSPDTTPQRLNQPSIYGFRPVVQKKKQAKPVVVEKCLPEINDKAPTEEERQNLCQVEEEPFMDRSCGGFRFFVRKFTDELFKKCLGNPSYDTIKGYAPKNLRYIHILRNAWKSLSEGERRNWQNLFNRCFENHSIQAVFHRQLSQELCIEEVNISEQQFRDRQWVCSVEPEFLPCPLCANTNSKRYNTRELMAHLSLSHASIRLYACHLCHKVFESIEALRSHPNCALFLAYTQECRERSIELSFDFAYMSLVCAECGLQLIVSPRCPAEHFASTLIHCLFSHSSDSLQVLMVFSCVELSSARLKLSFHTSSQSASAVCEVCNQDFSDLNELQKHLNEHKDQLKAAKCPYCPTSFLSQSILSSHLLEHLDNLPYITQFMPEALLIPAALDRNPEIRARSTGQPSTNVLPSKHLTWKPYNEENLFTNNSKLNCETGLQMVFNEKSRKIMVENPVDGAILTDNVYQCMKCFAIIASDHHTKLHLKDCFGLPTLMQASSCFNSKSPEHLVQLFDGSEFAFNRIGCSLCKSSHCSIIALQKHYVLGHATLCKFTRGTVTIQKYGESVQRKDWLTTEFDTELMKMIKASPLPPCKSEFDTFNEDYLTFEQPGTRYVAEDEENHSDYNPSSSSSANLIKSASNQKDKTLSATLGSSCQKVKMEVVDNDFETAAANNGYHNEENEAQRLVIAQEDGEIQNHNTFTSPSKPFKVKTEVVEPSECFAPNPNNLASEQPKTTPQQMDGRVYCCFLCAQPQANTEQLSEHFLSHPEQWSKCPICVRQSTWDREDFVGQMDFYKHMKTSHVRVQENFAYCLFCSFSITASQIQVSVNAMIRHIIYDCFESGMCMLCDEKFPSFKNAGLAEEIVGFHRQKVHRLVYDRLICSACKSGFHCRDVFLKHNCEKAFRCECNPSKCFKKASDFYSHIRESLEEKFSHAPIKSSVEVKPQDRRIEANQEYEKACKAQLEALKRKELEEEKMSTNEEVIKRKLGQKFETSIQPKRTRRRTGRRSRKRAQEDVFAEVEKVVNEMVDMVSNEALQALLSAKGTENSTMLDRRNSFKQFRKNPVCDVCGQKFRVAFELLLHKRAAHGFQDNKFPLPLDTSCFLCAACCLAFQTMDDYVEHMREHRQLTGCKKCSGVVGNDQEFYLHHPMHSNPRLSIYACSICCIHYDNEFNLLFHMAEEHKTVLAYFCKHCRICSTHGPTIIEHFVKYKCRKMLTIEYLGLCDAAQIKFQPKSPHDYIKKTKLKKIKIVKQAKCYHKCLLARNEPWITCRECNCPIPLSKWRYAFDKNAKLTTKRADDEPGIVDPKANFRRMINLTKFLRLGLDKGGVGVDQQDLPAISQALFAGSNSDVICDSIPICPEREAVVARARLMQGFSSQPPIKMRQSSPGYSLKAPVSSFSVSPRQPIRPLKVLPNPKLLTAKKYHIPDLQTPKQSPSSEKRQPEVAVQGPNYAAGSGLHHPDEVEYLQSKAGPSSSTTNPYEERASHMFQGAHHRPKLVPRVLRRKAASNLDRALFVARNANLPRFNRENTSRLAKNAPSTSSASGSNNKRPKYTLEMDCPIDKNPHFRHLLLFAFNRGQTAAAAAEDICNLYGEDAISEWTAQIWFNKFKKGNFDLEDIPPDFSNGQVKAPLKEDGRERSRVSAEKMDLRPPNSKVDEPSSETDDEEIIFEEDQQPPPAKKPMPELGAVLQRKLNPPMIAKPFVVLPPSTSQRRTQLARMAPLVVLKPRHSILANEEDVKNKINFMKVMPVTALYLCVTCNTTSDSQMEAVLHQFERHAIKDIKYKLNCPVCQEHFTDLALFYAHISQRPGHLFEQSKWCNFKFRDASSANKHNAEHEKTQLSQSKQQSCGGVKCCGLCGSVKDWWIVQLPGKQTIIDHTTFHGFETMDVCRICDKYMKVMKNHFQNSHLNVEFENEERYKFECKACKKELPKDQLAEHFQINHTYTLIEFLPGKDDGNMVITAKQELHKRFFPESK